MDTTLQLGKNTGVLEVAPDFNTQSVMGGETNIIDVVRNVAADWRTYESAGEWQRDMTTGFESDACMSYAANDQLQTYGNFMIETNQWPTAFVAWLKNNNYIGTDGRLHFSPRFIARMSNTTINGNSFAGVWDAIQQYGLVPYSMWSMPTDAQFEAVESQWALFYEMPPSEVLAMGKAFLAQAQIAWEWVLYPGSGITETGAVLAEALQISPLHILIPVCAPWNTADVIPACDQQVQHGVQLSCVDTAYHILDHYQPFDKQLGHGYEIPYVGRGVIFPNGSAATTPAPLPPQYAFNVTLAYGAPAGTDVTALQTALQTLKNANGQPYMKQGVFGPYGPQTATALASFQHDHGITDPQPGHDFGPATRALMAQLLNA